MTLKINNVIISSSDLTGGNSALRYFNLDSALLIPNKEGYRILGSSLERDLLKQKANSSINYNIKYVNEIFMGVNPGDNTDLFDVTQEQEIVVSNFADNSRYIRTVNNFTPGTNDWTIELSMTTNNNVDAGNYVSEKTNYSISLGSTTTLNNVFSSNGSSWTSSSTAGQTTLQPNTRYYIKYEYIYSTHTFNVYIKTKKRAAWGAPDYTNTDGIYPSTNYLQFGVSRTSVACCKGTIYLSDIKIKIGDNVWFDGATAVEGTDYQLVGTPTITTNTVNVYTPKPFTFSFNVASSALTEGTKYLLEHPNLVKVKTENYNLYFKFPWLDNNWKALPGGTLVSGDNSVVLEGTSSTITLTVNVHAFPIISLPENMPSITTGYLAYRESFDI